MRSTTSQQTPWHCFNRDHFSCALMNVQLNLLLRFSAEISHFVSRLCRQVLSWRRFVFEVSTGIRARHRTCVLWRAGNRCSRFCRPVPDHPATRPLCSQDLHSDCGVATYVPTPHRLLRKTLEGLNKKASSVLSGRLCSTHQQSYHFGIAPPVLRMQQHIIHIMYELRLVSRVKFMLIFFSFGGKDFAFRMHKDMREFFRKTNCIAKKKMLIRVNNTSASVFEGL